MSSVAYVLSNPTAFAATAGAKTILNAIAPAGHGLALVEFAISFDGVTASAVPALVEICTSTQAGAGTSAEAATIKQVRGRLTSGSAPTSGTRYSAEPTTLTVVRTYYVTQYNGLLIVQLPLGREIECDSSGGTDKAIAMRINVSANVNAKCYMELEATG